MVEKKSAFFSMFACVAADHIMRTARIVCGHDEYQLAVNVLILWKNGVISTCLAENTLSDIFERADPTLSQDLHSYMVFLQKVGAF